jgi:hypothetical protein
MAFKAGFIIMAPDGDPIRHRSSIKTSKLEITTVVVNLFDFDETVDVCTDLVRKKGVQALLLCAYFNQKEVAKIAEAVGEEIPIHVARSDVPGMMKMAAIFGKEGWLLDRPYGSQRL